MRPHWRRLWKRWTMSNILYLLGMMDCAKGRRAWLPFESYLNGYAHQYEIEAIENEQYPI